MPTLHISLGVYNKIYDKLEEDASVIDQKIFRHRVKNPEDETDAKTNFNQSIQSKIKERANIQKAIHKKQEDIEEALDNIPLKHIKKPSQNIKKTLETIGQARQEINEMVIIYIIDQSL